MNLLISKSWCPVVPWTPAPLWFWVPLYSNPPQKKGAVVISYQGVQKSTVVSVFHEFKELTVEIVIVCIPHSELVGGLDG